MTQLEEDLAGSRTQCTDAQYEVRRLTLEKEKLDDRVTKLTSENIKKEGGEHSSGATIARLQAQLMK